MIQISGNYEYQISIYKKKQKRIFLVVILPLTMSGF